jgi:acetyl-CoA carboxylase biotin carboxyl carrier protein
MMARKAAEKTPAKPTQSGGRIGQQTDVSTVERLVELLRQHDLTELCVQDGDVVIELRRGTVSAAPAAVAASAPTASAAPAAPVAPTASAPKAEPVEKVLEIRSPMVGTFYTAPSPDSEPYVRVGSAVGDDAVVCIVEAMKVMNEIKAECAGVISEVCVRNAQPVEYGQVLFRVKPA